ncbi:MAG: sulfite exporter TauE/SafE family protein [Gammaproteobacteria bacterium]|nr:sulfite exporter TauE/SafE family protein [Gammaproteobacteria bacterium]
MFESALLMFTYFFLIGVVVGISSMVFGIGGGLIIVPAVSLFLQFIGYSHDIAMKAAVATSLVTIIASTLNSLYKQHKLQNVPWSLVSKFLPFVIMGGITGSILSNFVSGIFLSYLFIIFLSAVILFSFFNKNFTASYKFKEFKEPSKLSARIVGFMVGSLSVLMGVGGNILFVPYLRRYKLPMKNATAFTLSIMPLLALIGTLGYMATSMHVGETKMPPYSIGYINMPAFILITCGSFLGAYFGQKLLMRIRDKFHANAYLFFLMIILLLMIQSAGLFKLL